MTTFKINTIYYYPAENEYYIITKRTKQFVYYREYAFSGLGFTNYNNNEECKRKIVRKNYTSGDEFIKLSNKEDNLLSSIFPLKKYTIVRELHMKNEFLKLLHEFTNEKNILGAIHDKDDEYSFHVLFYPAPHRDSITEGCFEKLASQDDILFI